MTKLTFSWNRGAEALAEEKAAKAAELAEEARRLQDIAGAEDVTVRAVDYWKETKKGRKNYPQ